MFTTIALLMATQASAAGLAFPPDLDTRSYKFEWYSQVDPSRPVSSDQNWLDLEFWSGVVVCKRVALVETCTFKDQEAYHGYHTKEAENVDSTKVTVPGTLEIEWTDRGRVKKYDFSGNDETFWTSAEESGRSRFNRMRPLQPNAVRRMGLKFEESLARTVLGLMEVERTVSSSRERPWEPSGTPWSGRRFEPVEFTVGASKPKIEMKVVGEENGMAIVATTGLVTESPVINDVLRDIKTEIVGEAIIDLQTGMLVLNKVQTQTQGPYRDLMVLTQLLFPYQDGMTAGPGELPGNPMAAGQ